MGELVKKKIISYSSVLVVILFFLGIFVSLSGNKEQNISRKVSNTVTPIVSMNTNGNILYDENEYYKRYTITCTKAVNEVKSQDSSNDIEITFNKSELDKPGIKSSNGIVKDVEFAESKEDLILKFKKYVSSDNKIYIDKADAKKVIVLIGKKNDLKKYKIVIDPGHGGRDPGNMLGDIKEKDYTLKITKFMYNDLLFNGCDVLYTREKDVELDQIVKYDLRKRASLANDNKVNVFVSIHINAGNPKDSDYKKYNGITTYYATNKDSTQNSERTKFADIVQKAAIKSDGWNDRKTLYGNYAVLKLTDMPSILVECGFLSNADDLKRLNDDKVLNNLANNIDQGVITYLKTTK